MPLPSASPASTVLYRLEVSYFALFPVLEEDRQRGNEDTYRDTVHQILLLPPFLNVSLRSS